MKYFIQHTQDKGLKDRIYVGLGKEEQLNGEVLRNAIAYEKALSKLKLLSLIVLQ